MSYKTILEIVFAVVGGLGIFLLGMKHMSEGLQTVSGDRLRKLIGSVTNNRIMAAVVGTAVTCIIQSSSVTTVMVVGFVNSGLMTLRQAVGVILGANIGTTVTAWILVLAIGKYGLPILGIAAMVYLFAKRERTQFIAMAVMGIGMVFFGLELMKNGFKPIRGMPEFVEAFKYFQATSYLGVLKCAAVGCILTLIVQSSSATVGITIGLASTGVISFETAAALVLGENIGTTITAYLASLGTKTNARRAAYGHILFNTIGVLWVTASFPMLMRVVEAIVGSYPGATEMVNGVETFPLASAGIAATHTTFNVVNTVIFIPLVPLFTKLLERLVPDKPFKEAEHLTRLDIRMLDTPLVVLEQSRHEILEMSEGSGKMLDCLREVIDGNGSKAEKTSMLFRREEIFDKVQQEIVTFLTDLLAQQVPHSIAKEAHRQMEMADEYESVSDYVVTILKLFLRIENEGLVIAGEMKDDLLSLHDGVREYWALIHDAVEVENRDIMTKARPRSAELTHKFRELRARHLARLSAAKVDPMLSTCYPDMLNAYRKLKDHLLTAAENLPGVES